jgi:iron complex outermembrane receptor protein
MFVCISLFGQNSIPPDTLKLPEFELKSSFSVDNYGVKRIRIDSSFLVSMLGADLSTLLNQRSTIFIKSYGNGTLASPSFRGTSAHHTQVLWNGISLNSPMLGQIDLSQIPVSQFDAVDVIYGPSGISQTSGAFGGVVDLVTKPDWNNRNFLLISQGLGSFTTYRTNMNAISGNAVFQSHIKLNTTWSKNNFPYTNDTAAKVRQVNASFSQTGVSQEMFWRIGENQLLTTRFWYSLDSRNLPPSTTNQDSMKKETMDDKAVRAALEYRYFSNSWNLNARMMVNDQTMIYQNNKPLINALHHFTSIINKVRMSVNPITGLSVKAGIDGIFDRVDSDNYTFGIVRRSTFSVFADVKHDLGKFFKASCVVREEMVDSKLSVPAASLGLDVKPLNFGFSVYANISHNYRFPTLNDLYWDDWGNPDLVPETNFSMEAGATVNNSTTRKNIFAELNTSVYYSRIFNMITWSPSAENSNIWTPDNIGEVLSRGVETTLNLSSTFFGFNIEENVNYNFCQSTYQTASSPYDEKVGKQLIYVPVHTLNAIFSAERRNFFFRYTFTYVSARYTGTDNSNIMPGYSLTNIILGKNIDLNKIVLTLQLDINNLFNLNYQSIPNRPMPGINKMVTIRMSFSDTRDKGE